MRSIKARFEHSKASQPLYGDYLHLAIAVRDQNFSNRSIGLAFNELVSKAEYESSERKQLLKYLRTLTRGLKGVEEGRLKAENHVKSLFWKLNDEPVASCN